MNDCIGCEYTFQLDEYFDAIFDFMDTHEIDYGELPHVRIDIHNHFGEPHRKAVYEDE